MSRTTIVVPWWALPFYVMIWLCSAVVQAVIIVFIVTAQVSFWVLREIGRTFAKGPQ